MKGIYLCVIFFILMIAGCKTTEEKRAVNFERTENSIVIKQILYQSPLTEFCASDSIIILKKIYDSVLSEKLNDLQSQWEIENSRWEQAHNELQAIKNPLMKKAYGNRVDLMEQDKLKIEKIILIYKTAPEKTQLSKYTAQKEFYERDPDFVLGYICTMHFVGKEGELPEKQFTRTYLLDRNKKSVLGIIK